VIEAFEIITLKNKHNNTLKNVVKRTLDLEHNYSVLQEHHSTYVSDKIDTGISKRYSYDKKSSCYFIIFI